MLVNLLSFHEALPGALAVWPSLVIASMKGSAVGTEQTSTMARPMAFAVELSWCVVCIGDNCVLVDLFMPVDGALPGALAARPSLASAG